MRKNLVVAGTVIAAAGAGIAGQSAMADPASNHNATVRTAPGATCLSTGFTPHALNTAGMPAPAAATAKKLYRAALTCDTATLVRLTSHADLVRTKNGFKHGPAVAAKAWSLKNGTNKRYETLLRVLSTRPILETFEAAPSSAEWPRLTNRNVDLTNPREWRDVVRAGLCTQAQADQEVKRRKTQHGGDLSYTGWRLFIKNNGTVDTFVK